MSVLVHHDHAHAIVDREHAWLRRIVGHTSRWPSAHAPKGLRFVQVDPIRNRHTNATEVIVITEAFDLEMICQETLSFLNPPNKIWSLLSGKLETRRSFLLTCVQIEAAIGCPRRGVDTNRLIDRVAVGSTG